MNSGPALAVLALLNSLALMVAVALGVTWMLHAWFPNVPHPWHPYVPWAAVVSITVYLLLPTKVRELAA